MQIPRLPYTEKEPAHSNLTGSSRLEVRFNRLGHFGPGPGGECVLFLEPSEADIASVTEDNLRKPIR